MSAGFLSNAHERQYTATYKLRDDSIQQKVHYAGNNVKAMHIAFEASLRKLRTNYIDIFTSIA